MNPRFSANLLRGLAFLCLFLATNCKKQPQSSASTQLAAQSATDPQAQIDQFMSNLQTQHLDFNTEYQTFINAIAAYQASSIYANPQTDNQRLLNILAGMMSSFSQSAVQQGLQQDIQSQFFSQFNNAFLNMSTYQSEIQSFVTEAAAISNQNNSTVNPPALATQAQAAAMSIPGTNAVTGTDTVTDTSSETSTNTSTGKQINKNFLIVSGSFVFLLTALCIVHVGLRAKELVTEKVTLAKYRENFARNFMTDHAIFLKTGILIYFSVMIAQSMASTGGIDPKDLADPAIAVAALSVIASVYWSFEAGMNIYYSKNPQAFMDATGTAYKKGSYYKLDILGSVFKGASGEKPLENPIVSKGGNVWEEAVSNTIFAYDTGKKTTANIEYTKSIGGALLAGLLAGTSFYAYSQFHLDAQNQPADQTFLAAVLRFFGVCQLLSAQGKLVLN